MLTKQLLNEKSLKIIFAGVISYYFGLIILQYDFKAVTLLLLAVFVILFLTKIEYAFYFLLASRSIVDVYYSAEVIEGTRMTHLIGGLLSVLFVYYIIVVSRYNILSFGINKIYGLFLLLSIFPIFFTENLVAGFGYWLRLFQGFLILNITILLVLSAEAESYKKRINTIFAVVIISIFIPYILFLKNVIYDTGIVKGGYERFDTFTSHTNVFSYLLLIVFPFCLFLYSITARNFKKILWFIFMAIMIVTIYITYTRNVWIGLAILLVAWSTLRKNFMITFSTMGIIILMIFFSPAVQDRLEDIYILLTSESFFELDPRLGSSRIGIWQANIRYFIDNSTLIEKLLGNGFDIRTKIKIMRWGHFVTKVEHNNYLTLLMSTGICGISFYLLYILKLFQESFKLLRRSKETYFRNLAQVFISVLLAYVIISTNTHILWNLSFQYYFSVFAGFVIAANILEKIKYEKS